MCTTSGSPAVAAIPPFDCATPNNGWEHHHVWHSTVKTTNIEVVCKLLLLSFFRLGARLCIFQYWTPDFYPGAERGISSSNAKAVASLKIPT
jgi:hypothetical protein